MTAGAACGGSAGPTCAGAGARETSGGKKTEKETHGTTENVGTAPGASRRAFPSRLLSRRASRRTEAAPPARSRPAPGGGAPLQVPPAVLQ